MGKYFGTDGIRGAYGTACVNPEFACRFGSALGRYLLGKRPESRPSVLIGRDTRSSGKELVQALSFGLERHGVNAQDMGIVPTPCVAFSLIERRADLAIMVTASHNPASDNGMKLFNDQGFKPNEFEEELVEAFVDEELDPVCSRDGSLPPLPVAERHPIAGTARYVDHMVSLLELDCMRGRKVVLDLANGATCETTPAVFKLLGAEIVLIGHRPNGENINQGVGSEYPDTLARSVLAHKADMGIAHDGDGDRLIVCDETGTVLAGDVLLALFGVHAMRSGNLKAKTLVTTVQSNLGLDEAIRAVGGKVERTSVGDRHVAARMREIGANFGGENSGHFIFSDFATTGDGLLAALKTVELICESGRPLSALRREIVLFPHISVDLHVSEKRPLEGLRKLPGLMEKIEKSFGGEGRLLVRYSGTEPKLRMLVEGKDEKKVAKAMRTLKAAVREELEVID